MSYTSYKEKITTLFSGSIWKKLWKLFFWGSIFLFISFFTFYFAILIGLFGKIPSREELKAIKNPISSEIFAADGSLLGKFYIENRTHTSYEDLPEHLIKALVATEDVRFYKHNGIDYRSYGRVLIKSILQGNKSAGGGSTISQQLSKNLFPRSRYSFLTMPVNKIKEAIVARRLESVYSKEEILTLYLNTVSFGEKAFGIATASERFFSTSPQDLALDQAAVLVGMLKATSAYSPRLNPEKSKTRRNVVINQMLKANYVDSLTADVAKKLPLNLAYNRRYQKDDPVPYFREVLKQTLKPWLETYEKSDGTTGNLFTDGLKIYTTIDPKIQQYAERAVEEHMKNLFFTFKESLNGGKPWGTNQQIIEDAKKRSHRYISMKEQGFSESDIDNAFKELVEMEVFSWNKKEKEAQVRMSPADSLMHYLYFMNAGFMVLDAKTGDIKAWVGGIDHKYFKQDRVSSPRQVGSTFKPFVYASAIEDGIDPCKYYSNEQRVYKNYKDWSPRNSDGNYEGSYTLKGALSKSVNTVSVEVLFDVGIDSVVKMAQNLGIINDIPKVPSIALGSAELNVLEMTGAYTTFANNGLTSHPRPILKIEDYQGNLIKDFNTEEQKKKERNLSEETNAIMVEMLKAVVDNGTAKSLRQQYGLYGEMAGKTGTTQDQTDGWFIGFTPDLVAGAWVGGEDKRIRFSTTKLGQGAKTALPIWALFFKYLYEDPDYRHLANNKFPTLNKELAEQIDCPISSKYRPNEKGEIEEVEIEEEEELSLVERFRRKLNPKREKKEMEKQRKKKEREEKKRRKKNR